MAADDSTQQPTLWDAGEPVKRCAKCGLLLPLDRFRFCYANGKKWLIGQCKKCQNRYVTEHRVARMKRDPEFRRKQHRRVSGYRRRNAIGVSHEEYRLMFESQNGLCAICGRPEKKLCRPGHAEVKDLCADHDHATGRLRQLLCHGCNVMLGHAHDDPAILRAAADYIERHKEASDEQAG